MEEFSRRFSNKEKDTRSLKQAMKYTVRSHCNCSEDEDGDDDKKDN